MSATTAPNETGPVLDMTLPSDACAPAVARAAIRELTGTVPDELLDKLALVASELATNAVVHAPLQVPPTLYVQVRSDRVVLAVGSVANRDFTRDSVRPLPGAAGGFGLRVVDALADRWWVEHDGLARVVCEFDHRSARIGLDAAPATAE
jgi:anti-sigma regulatory factor (Ser/Thr protein kinase)